MTRINKPGISVIVAAFNAQDYIERCLNSLKQQTLKDIEVIAVDDGSTDKTGTILDEYALEDSRFHVCHIQNGGVAHARQYALERTTGEYVIHADTDDWLDSDMLENLYNKAKEEDADFIMCDIVEHYADRTISRNFNPESLEQETFFQNLLLIKYTSGLWHKLVRRSIFTEYNINFDISMTTSEDFYVLCQIFTHPIKIAYIPETYYHYDKSSNPNSITKKKIPLSHIDSQRKCIDYLETHFDKEKFKSGINHRKYVLKELMWKSHIIDKKTLLNTYPEVNSFFKKGNKDRLGFYSETFYIFNGHYHLGIFLYYYRSIKNRIKFFIKTKLS